MVNKILIVEDDIAFGTMLRGWFKRNGYVAVLCQSVESAKDELCKEEYNLIMSDLRLPDGDGIMLLAWIRENKIHLPVMIMTSYGEIQSAVAAIKLGAEDFLEKPINPTILKEKIEQILSKEQQPERHTAKEKVNNSKIVLGKSPAAQKMQEYVLMVAPTKMTVLILGESGSGKEYVARMIHENSTRKNEPFIAVDCGSLSKELAPSELFGHLKGSFTSAASDKKGVFEQAKGGTVFLDEIGNLPYEVQVQLLRALQEQKVRPVGSAKDITVDIRIIAATNENLESAIRQGEFREDLYHRLNEFSISVPPLRERGKDIAMFANHFLTEANNELDKNVKGFSPQTLDILEHYRWGGNLRELRNVIRRAVLFATQDHIIPDNLPILTAAPDHAEEMAMQPGNEKAQIEEALKRARGNKSLAAEMLQITRKTLYNKMHSLNIPLPRS
ncbi:MAG: sigma-54 dependent transcriptional regulator [Bacteroidales bacterium]